MRRAHALLAQGRRSILLYAGGGAAAVAGLAAVFGNLAGGQSGSGVGRQERAAIGEACTGEGSERL